ncbi:hypothetical protein Vretifemale_5761 [Volvox reticuliferus]|uniref:Protein kinase domain-containing protein n=1 Tax=Volvox reticuliferus TaxID=1737510 RepID=A0A8J4C5P8_9CHLO|nr:hypothetical protein Vretifemale_5761 [Volvox reticuliferus]
MASNGSAAQQAMALSPPAMVICMEYCDAGSLADAIVRGAFRQPALGLYGTTQPNMRAILATLLEVALALRHLHSLRLVHCDLKPSNVLLRYSARDPRGFTAKLSDFGLVRLMEPCGEGGRLAIPKGVTHGTITHMAPVRSKTDTRRVRVRPRPFFGLFDQRPFTGPFSPHGRLRNRRRY